MVDVTLRQGVEQRMREVLPELNELIDVTDHRAGSNPFYQPSK
jgi:Fe/S biogenesis protein NfuA